MPDDMIPVLKTFREKIYPFFSARQDATMELIDALSSNTNATSVVELSLNPLHRRNYCSITRVVDEFYASTDADKKMAQNQKITRLISQHCIPQETRHFHLFVVDITPNPRVFSPTLEDRGYVYAPNTVAGNTPVTLGHQYSIAAYLPEKTAVLSSPWIIPLSCERVATSQKGILVGMQQLRDCIQSQASFNNKLCVSMGDCAYSHPDCLWEAKKNPNQVHISRARNSRVFNYPVEVLYDPGQRGRPKQYGDRYDLRDNASWRISDDTLTFELTSKKGKRQIVEIECWDTILMRGTRQSILHDYPFRLLRVRVYKESGKLLFKRPLWLIAAGARRNELSLLEIFDCYRQRFDLEHFFRFGKDRLLMNKIQTPDVNHEEAWWQLTMLAYTQLFLARKIANNTIRPWEKYAPALRSPIQEKSPTQTQRDFARIIWEIGTPAKPPKLRKKSLGRQMGDRQVKRQIYSIISKSKKSANIADMAV